MSSMEDHEFFDPDYDESEDSPAIPPPENDQKFSLNITLSEHALSERVVREVSDRLVERFERIHRKRIEEAVDARVVETTRRELDETVRAVIAAGWREPDRWGGEGRTVTLAERISGVLAADVDNYSRGQTRYQALMKEAVEAAFKKELAPLVEKAKAEFKAALDDGIRSRLADALKGALGLR